MLEMIKKLVDEKVLKNEVLMYNEDDDIAKEKLEKAEEILNYIERFKSCLISVLNGNTVDEDYKDIFFRVSEWEHKVYCLLAREIEHILKLAFSTLGPDDPVRNDWTEEVKRNQYDCVTDSFWDMGIEERYVNYLRNNLQNCYDWAITFYENPMRHRNGSHLVDNRNNIPEKCPWTLEELLDGNIQSLICKVQIGE